MCASLVLAVLPVCLFRGDAIRVVCRQPAAARRTDVVADDKVVVVDDG